MTSDQDDLRKLIEGREDTLPVTLAVHELRELLDERDDLAESNETWSDVAHRVCSEARADVLVRVPDAVRALRAERDALRGALAQLRQYWAYIEERRPDDPDVRFTLGILRAAAQPTEGQERE